MKSRCHHHYTSVKNSNRRLNPSDTRTCRKTESCDRQSPMRHDKQCPTSTHTAPTNKILPQAQHKWITAAILMILAPPPAQLADWKYYTTSPHERHMISRDTTAAGRVPPDKGWSGSNTHPQKQLKKCSLSTKSLQLKPPLCRLNIMPERILTFIGGPKKPHLRHSLAVGLHSLTPTTKLSLDTRRFKAKVFTTSKIFSLSRCQDLQF
jgi:hypothetical protein